MENSAYCFLNKNNNRKECLSCYESTLVDGRCVQTEMPITGCEITVKWGCFQCYEGMYLLRTRKPYESEKFERKCIDIPKELHCKVANMTEGINRLWCSICWSGYTMIHDGRKHYNCEKRDSKIEKFRRQKQPNCRIFDERLDCILCFEGFWFDQVTKTCKKTVSEARGCENVNSSKYCISCSYRTGWFSVDFEYKSKMLTQLSQKCQRFDREDTPEGDFFSYGTQTQFTFTFSKLFFILIVIILISYS